MSRRESNQWVLAIDLARAVEVGERHCDHRSTIFDMISCRPSQPFLVPSSVASSLNYSTPNKQCCGNAQHICPFSRSSQVLSYYILSPLRRAFPACQPPHSYLPTRHLASVPFSQFHMRAHHDEQVYYGRRTSQISTSRSQSSPNGLKEMCNTSVRKSTVVSAEAVHWLG